MYRNTRFSEILKGLPRSVFEKHAQQLGADKHCKGFRAWDQLIALMYAQIVGASSLREVETGFNSQKRHHYHLGTREVRSSTFADANHKRPAALFESVCHKVGRRFRQDVGDFLHLLDSTPIPLKGLGYDDWTRDNHSSRTQGLKVHVLMTSDTCTPLESIITAPNVTDIEIGRQIPVEKGQTYVFDKGYCDYNWWYQLHCSGAYFITRFKSNAGVDVHLERTIDELEHPHILGDQLVSFRNKRPGGKRVNQYHGTPLRRVTVKRENGKPPLVLATNDQETPAHIIAERYKARWGIELFFKWLKQNLKIPWSQRKCRQGADICGTYHLPIAANKPCAERHLFQPSSLFNRAEGQPLSAQRDRLRAAATEGKESNSSTNGSKGRCRCDLFRTAVREGGNPQAADRFPTKAFGNDGAQAFGNDGAQTFVNDAGTSIRE